MKYIKLLFLMLLTTFFPIGAYAQTNRLYIPDVVMSRGSESTLSVYMDNTDEVTAVEFTLEVPDGFSVNPSSAVLSERAKEHQITARKLKNGKYKFAILSQSNALFDGIAGLLFTVRVQSPDNVSEEGDYPLIVSSAVMSVKSGQNVLQETSCGKISIMSMPNLHVISLDCSEPVAGQPLTVKWKIRNDGHGSTGDTEWKDYVWLVPNISVGTSMEGSKLLTTVGNISALAPGEYYENTVNVNLEERIYGNYDLVVTSNMYGATNIDFTKTGGEPPIPYDPENANYGFLTAKGNAAYVTVKEESEYYGTSDNFFYKRIHIQVPPLADIQVPNVVVNIDKSIYIREAVYSKPLRENSIRKKIGNVGVPLRTYDGGNYNVITYQYVSGIVSETSFYSGQRVVVTATIKNEGGTDIKNTDIKNILIISSTPDLSEGDAYIIDVTSETINLNSGGSTTISFWGYIPIDWHGDTYFIVIADIEDSVYELANIENNTGTSNKVDVLLTPGADLEPYNLSVPQQISTGASFNIKYSVRNIGPGVPNVNEWKDKVYISAKNTGLDNDAICIGEFKRTGIFDADKIVGYSIAADAAYDGEPMVNGSSEKKTRNLSHEIKEIYLGATYANGFSVKVDRNLPVGTYYIYVKTDANDDVFEFDGEDNNVIVSQPIVLANPDLTADLLSLSEETLITDNKVAVSWKLRNIGADIANATVKDGFYASKNANGGNPVFIADVTNTVTINAGQENVQRAYITIPANSALDGTLYFFVKTNIDGAIAESNTSNNSSRKTPKSFEYMDGISKVNGMNLSISSLQLSENVTPGETVYMAYTITNNGTLTINKNVSQEVFFSKNKTFDTSARPCEIVGSLPDVLDLKSGESVKANVQLTVPTDMMGGQNYVHVVVNKNHSLLEKKFDDNNVKSPIYINGNLPNLATSGMVVPATIMTSEKTEVEWTLTNVGDWDAGSCNCTVFLSVDDIWNEDDKKLANVSIAKLAKGESKPIKTSIVLDDDVVGNYYLIVKAELADRAEEVTIDDNTTAVAFMAKQSLLPDLVISDLSSEGIWRDGQSVIIKAKVRNVGDDATHKDKWADVFYLSEGYTLDVEKAIKLASKTHVGKLGKTGEYEISTLVNIPADVKGYYVLFAVADGSNAMVEKTKENNQARITVYVEDKYDTPSDLMVKNISAPAHITAGDPVTISYTLSNNGTYRANGILRDVFYMSKDNQWDKEDVMVGVVTDEINLEPGNEIVRTVTGRINNMPEGNYYLIVRTNSTHAIAETDYENNIAVQSSACMLDFTSLTLSSSVTVNTSGMYKLPIYGLNGKTIGIYLSTPENATAGLYSSYENVPSTARYEYAATDLEKNAQEILIPNVQEGTYYILAQDNAAYNRSLSDYTQDIIGSHKLSSKRNSSGYFYKSIGIVSNEFFIGKTLPSEVSTIMTLTAREVPFGATTLSIAEGGSNGWLSTEIHGALLDSIMDFRLAHGGEVIPAESITFYDQTSTKATFNLNDVETGSYDVVSELPNGTQATLPDGFKVVPGVNVNLGVKIDAPHWTHIDSPVPVTIAYANGGNTDIVVRGLLFASEGGDVGMTIEDLNKHENVLSLKPKEIGDNRGFITIPPGTQETFRCYFRQYQTGICYLKVFVVK